MAPASKIMTGARAVFSIGGKPIGFFSSCDWSYSVDVQPAYVLGRYSVAETTYTSAAPVTVRCAGFRAFDGKAGDKNLGPHQQAGAARLVPTLNDLLNAESVDILIVDRQTDEQVMRVINAKSTGYNTSLRAREQQTMSFEFMGMRVTTGQENDGNEYNANEAGAVNPFDM